MSDTLWHNGPIEEYQVRDCTTGECRIFHSFLTAADLFEEWELERPDHPLMLNAVVCST